MFLGIFSYRVDQQMSGARLVFMLVRSQWIYNAVGSYQLICQTLDQFFRSPLKGLGSPLS